MIYNIVSYNIQTNKFTLYLREWYFQGDQPDYTRVSDLSMEDAIGMVESGESADHSMQEFMKSKVRYTLEYNREFDKIHKERSNYG